jgi:hypothetical protein
MLNTEHRDIVSEFRQQQQKKSSDLDEAHVEDILIAFRKANVGLHQEHAHELATFCQEAHGSAANLSITCGTFPTTTTATESKALTTETNATVVVNSLLSGCCDTQGMSKETLLCNLMPTTDSSGSYTSCPSKKLFSIFHDVYITFLRDLFRQGLCVFHGISDKNRGPLLEALHGKDAVSPVVELEFKGGWLELYESEFGLMLCTFPSHHNSHLLWGALSINSRAHDVHGISVIRTVAAKVTDSAPPQVQTLVMLVNEVPRNTWSRHRNGAYAEAVMKGIRRIQFRLKYGKEEGDKRWAAWYHDCKVRAGKYVCVHLYMYW